MTTEEFIDNYLMSQVSLLDFILEQNADWYEDQMIRQYISDIQSTYDKDMKNLLESLQQIIDARD